MSRRRLVPEDTTKIDPAEMLASMTFGGSDGFIERQEARGQETLIRSETLPARILTKGGRETLEAAGVVFGEVVKEDPKFRFVTLPEGWQKVPTDHSMWSKLVDGDGTERASIFYKAAFYDRDAFMHVSASTETSAD